MQRQTRTLSLRPGKAGDILGAPTKIPCSSPNSDSADSHVYSPFICMKHFEIVCGDGTCEFRLSFTVNNDNPEYDVEACKGNLQNSVYAKDYALLTAMLAPWLAKHNATLDLSCKPGWEPCLFGTITLDQSSTKPAALNMGTWAQELVDLFGINYRDLDMPSYTVTEYLRDTEEEHWNSAVFYLMEKFLNPTPAQEAIESKVA